MKSQANKNIPGGILGRTVGILLLAGAVAAVVFYRADPEEAPADDSVRPIKSVVVGGDIRVPVLRFPGTIDAVTGVDLSFEVGGRIVEFPVVRGQEVGKGDVLAKLDDRDFRNRVKDAQAQLDLAESTLERIRKALELNAVSQEDYSKAKANRDVAKAQLAIAKKALDDSKLRAKFAGVVSETYVDNFATVAAGSRILKLQDMSLLTMDVQVPESYLLRGTSSGEKVAEVHCTATFDALPGRVFPVALREYSTAADPVTQTYRATFELEGAEGQTLPLLPGMTGTIVMEVPRKMAESADDGPSPVQVPGDAVGIDSDGSFFVWVLTPEEGNAGVWAASKRPVKAGQRSGELMTVSEGLRAGERIATAGVTLLTEGRRVRLLEEKAAGAEAPAAEAPAEGEDAPEATDEGAAAAEEP